MRKARTIKLATLLIGLLILVGVLLASEPVRKWQTRGGEEKEGVWDIESDTGGEKIRLKSGGKSYLISIDKLSEEDQQYVRKRREELASRGPSSDFEEEDPAEDELPERANKKYAVLVGVNDYAELRDLSYAVNDIELIRDQLLKMGFERDHIFTLSTGSDAANLPMKLRIEERIKAVLKEAGLDDMIFVALSGHGIQIGDNAYFCPLDTREEALEECEARFKWLVIDACRNNPSPSFVPAQQFPQYTPMNQGMTEYPSISTNLPPGGWGPMADNHAFFEEMENRRRQSEEDRALRRAYLSWRSAEYKDINFGSGNGQDDSN